MQPSVNLPNGWLLDTTPATQSLAQHLIKGQLTCSDTPRPGQKHPDVAWELARLDQTHPDVVCGVVCTLNLASTLAVTALGPGHGGNSLFALVPSIGQVLLLKFDLH